MISLLMPTLARPAAARRFLESVAARSRNLDRVEVVIYADDDDPGSHDLAFEGVSVTRIIGPSTTMGAFNTACLERARGQIVMLVNDDVLIRTDGWDERLLELDARYGDGVYLAYGNDLFKGDRISTFPILSRRTCELLVAPYPPVYRGGLIDYHLFDIFKRLQKLGHDRIRYEKDLVFEHLHYRTGKMPYDGTYDRRSRFGDDSTFLALRACRQAAAERLAAAIAGDPVPSWEPRWPAARRPANLTAAVAEFSTAFLADRALPVRWRLFLFTWYCGRYVASREREVAAEAAERPVRIKG
jgi:hypothetical protein